MEISWILLTRRWLKDFHTNYFIYSYFEPFEKIKNLKNENGWNIYSTTLFHSNTKKAKTQVVVDNMTVDINNGYTSLHIMDTAT